MELGYDPSLPAPSSIIQALLVCIKSNDFHAKLITLDKAKLDNDEIEDLLLIQLDTASWFNIYAIALKDIKKAMAKLESLSINLPRLRREYSKAHMEWKENGPNIMRRFYKFYGLGYSQDPILKQKKLPTFNYASSDSSPSSNISSSLISDSLTEEEAHVLSTNFSIPEAVYERFANIYIDIFIPNRLLELMVTEPLHKIWAYGNMALPAPIPMSLLLLLVNEKDKDALQDALLSVVAENSNIFTHHVTMGCPFGMNAFDSHRCSSPHGIITTSKNVGNIRGKRDSAYLSNVFNFHRPYLKCACEKHGKKDACRSNNIIWLDHALWFILHNIDDVFAGDTLKQKMLLFFKWIQGEAQEALKGQIIFTHYRKLLKQAITHIALQDEGPMFQSMDNDMTKFIEKALALDANVEVFESISHDAKRQRRDDSRGKFTGRSRGWHQNTQPPSLRGGRRGVGIMTGSSSCGSYMRGRNKHMQHINYADAQLNNAPDSLQSTASTNVGAHGRGNQVGATNKAKTRITNEGDMGDTIKQLMYE